MRLPELRSPFARAVVPVLAGLVVLALIAAVTWGSAVYIAGNEDPPERLAPTELDLGSAERRADDVAENGPLLFQGLGEGRDRSIVVDHHGEDAIGGWQVYLASPADRAESCHVTQNEGTATFVDCEGRTLDVDDLAAPPTDVHPVIDGDQRTLSIDLRGFSSAPATTGSS